MFDIFIQFDAAEILVIIGIVDAYLLLKKSKFIVVSYIISENCYIFENSSKNKLAVQHYQHNKLVSYIHDSNIYS